MTSINEKLKKVRDALHKTGVPVFHYRRPNNKPLRYIIWQEDGSNTDMWADNHMKEQQLHGTIDLYTTMEYDEGIDLVQEELNGVMVGWSLTTVDYEDETNLIHYEWEWNL